MTVRNIAAQADSAASAIDYYFGSLEHLYAEAQADALTRAREWSESRIEQLQAFSGQPLTREARGSIIATLIDDWTETQRGLAMAWREACAMARSGHDLESHRSWASLWMQFWQRVADILSLPSCGALLALFFEGEATQHLLRWNRSLDRALLEETVQALLAFALEQRLDEAPVRLIYRELASSEYSGLASTSDLSPHPMDVAAAEILLDGGIPKLTFRSVAARAGVTLGTASYRFGSKSRLLNLAFDQVYRSAMEGISEEVVLQTENLLEQIVQSIARDDQIILRAFDEIIHHISRDPEYVAMRGAIRGFRDPAAPMVLGVLLNARAPSSLAAAFSSICRGLDHFSLAVSEKEATELGMNALGLFAVRSQS